MQSPDWDELYQVAAGQAGYFTLPQAAEAGYSRQLIRHHQEMGRVASPMRGIYRLRHYPVGEHEDLVCLWLWSGQVAVCSHETALMLHELSDALPAKRHLTFPASWRRRRVSYPAGVVPYFQELRDDEVAWVGCVPVTVPLRTLLDCHRDRVQPDLVAQAIAEAVARGLVRADELPEELT